MMRDEVRWTAALVERLRVLWDVEKLPSGEIARVLREESGEPVTKDGVCGKARRVGCAWRGSPLPEVKAAKPPRPLRQAGHAAGPITRGWVAPGRVDGCQWIEGPAVGGVKCGGAVLPGTAWCAAHRARVYQPVERPAQKKEG